MTKSHLRPLIAALSLFAVASVSANQISVEPLDKAVNQVVKMHHDRVQKRLEPRLRFAGTAWPPAEVNLLAIKESKQLELWVADKSGKWFHVHDYKIKGMSGELGPKLKQGDEQVPEGFYRVNRLNPASNFHLSMKLNYPNLFDKVQAAKDGRANLGGDIFIHGNEVSKGCLAIGDKAIEDLFVMAALVGPENVSVMIAPKDFRSKPVEQLRPDTPAWVLELHQSIAKNMQEFPLPN